MAREGQASDLHLSVGKPPHWRRHGILEAFREEILTREGSESGLRDLLGEEDFYRLNKIGDMEKVLDLPNLGRFRMAFVKHRSGIDATARLIPTRILGFDELGLPPACRGLTHWAQGLVLVTGPAGCGKSCTLATLVQMVNQERPDHIITLEDPIEFLFENAECQITQRQMGVHTLSPDAALRAALREDPDILVVSELRDLETIQLAVSAAETGHLVFATLNTMNASRTIYRLIDSFPPEEQGVIRNMVSESLRGVISQQLLPLKDGSGVVPAFEVLLVNSAVGNMIRKDEAHQLGTAMMTGKSSGMVLLDDSLKHLVETGKVEGREAWKRAINPKDFEKYLS
jgi:twitching motility protein PilT